MEELTNNELRRNQTLLLAFFLYSTFSGAIRKWVTTGNSSVNNILLAVQLLLPFGLMLLMRREKNIFTTTPTLAYAVLLVFFALNPMNMTLYHGIFGFLMHFSFWLMMFAYLHERDAFPFEKLIVPFVIVCLIQSVLCFFQFTMPITHLINRYESGESTSGFEGGMVRVSGTFSYIGGYAAFLYFFGFLVWALLIENKRNLLLLLLLSTLCLVCAFMNGSRTTTLMVAVCIGIGFMSYGTFTNKLRVLFVVPVLLILASVYNLDTKLSTVVAAYDAFTGRVESGVRSGESNNRIFETVIEIGDFKSENTFFGLGLGATYQGATQTWGKSPYVTAYGFFEEEPERILLEGGYALLLIRALLFIWLIKLLKIPKYLSIPIMIYLFFFAQMVSSTFQSTFTFLGIALLDKMYYLKELAAETEENEGNEGNDEQDFEDFEEMPLETTPSV